VHRRTFLTAASVGVASATAGCGLIGETVRLSEPRKQTDADGRETDLLFENDGEEVAAVTVDQRTDPAAPHGPFKLRLHLSHRSSPDRYDEPTSVEAFQFDLRTPPTADHSPAEIYFLAPRPELQDVIEFGETDDGWTRIAADSPGDFGRGTINIDTIVSPVGEMTGGLDVRVTATLGEGGFNGTTYEIDGKTRFEPV
jgi:hypothetical protein